MFRDEDTQLNEPLYKYSRRNLVTAHWIGFAFGMVAGAALTVAVSSYAHPPCAQAPDQECSTITDIDLETGEVTYIYRCPGG